MLLPELGALSGRRVAALCGGGPGGQGQRHEGRAGSGAALYMGCPSAVRFNPLARAMYQCLRAAGEPGKVALVAAMRNLLVALNAMARDGRPWDPALAGA